MPPEYKDFDLIVSGSAGAYTVEAQGPGQMRVPPAPFAYHETEEMHAALARIEQGLAPGREQMQALGTMLFEALLPRPVIRALERAPDALPPGVGLRLKLIVRSPELSHLPWELLYDPDQQIFIAARLSYPIVRFVESGTPAASLLARRPLRVLHVQANPPDTPTLSGASGAALLRQVLGAAGEVQAIEETTPAALRAALREKPGYHVLHYDGHAAFDEAAGEGFLYLHGEGRSQPLSGEMLAVYLAGTAVRLVVLMACQTATDSRQKRFSGIAQQLMRAGDLPAVVAMQFAIPDHSAATFGTELYQALAGDYALDAAVVEGRKAILAHLGGDAAAFGQPDWATPVLFMRSPDGRIFDEEGAGQENGAQAGRGVNIKIGDVSGSQITIGDVAGGNLSKP
jgi:hypothetical protein